MFTTAVAFITACGNNHPAENKSQTNTGRNPAVMAQTTPVPSGRLSLKNDNLNAVYQQYTLLTQALINGDIAEAKIAANAIAAGSKYIAGASGIESAAEAILAANDIETQRISYSGMSRDIAILIEKEGLFAGELYIAFCPMAFNDKGGMWITERKEIRNPYFGESMLACGEVRKTLR